MRKPIISSISFFVGFLIGVMTISSLASVPPSLQQDQSTIINPLKYYKQVISYYNTITIPAYASTDYKQLRLTDQQKHLLNIAYQEGESVKLKHPAIMQGILMNETLAGVLGREGDKDQPFYKRSFGVMQVKISTVRVLFRNYPQLKSQIFHTDAYITDWAIVHLLKTNDRADIYIAALYIKLLISITNNEARAIASYNLGPGAARQIRYPARFEYVKNCYRVAIIMRGYDYAVGLISTQPNNHRVELFDIAAL